MNAGQAPGLHATASHFILRPAGQERRDQSQDP